MPSPSPLPLPVLGEEGPETRHSTPGAAFGWRVDAREAPPRATIDANQAFAMGALLGGCQFYAAYPMTPSTSVFEYLAGHADRWGLVVKHAEDEIAAVNMCVGAAVADASEMAARGCCPVREGAYVGRVTPGGVAERAGLQAGDVITQLASQPVSSALHLQSLLERLQPGQQAPLTYVRKGRTHIATLSF